MTGSVLIVKNIIGVLPFLSMASPDLLPQEIAFLCPHGCPLSTSSLHGGHLADFGDGHIPPALVVGYALVAIILNVDHRRTIGCPHCLESGHEVSIRFALDYVRTQTSCV